MKINVCHCGKSNCNIEEILNVAREITQSSIRELIADDSKRNRLNVSLEYLKLMLDGVS